LTLFYLSLREPSGGSFSFWCLAIIGEYKSRFGGVNSRFGRREFPVALIREFAGKGLGYLNIFSTKW